MAFRAFRAFLAAFFLPFLDFLAFFLPLRAFRPFLAAFFLPFLDFFLPLRAFRAFFAFFFRRRRRLALTSGTSSVVSRISSSTSWTICSTVMIGVLCVSLKLLPFSPNG